jgi:Zn-dependent protease
MLMLLELPYTLLQIGFYALCGLVDSLRGSSRLRAEATTLINAPRAAVWRFMTADRTVFDGPPVTEMAIEPLADGSDLLVTRVSINGQEWGRVVCRRLVQDEARGVVVSEIVAHELSHPPELANEGLIGAIVEERPNGTALTVINELTVRSFRERITYPLGVSRRAVQIKKQCEKEAGTGSDLSRLSEHWLVVSFVALLSFWYLFGWRDALLLAVVVVLHEAGHALAMLMVGIRVQGIYLIPFFGGAVVPKTAYRTQGHLGFVALMGPGFSLIPAIGLAAVFSATGDTRVGDAALAFAVINASNLLPIYPLDGGLILNALLGSVSTRVAHVTGWIGVLAGLGIGLYLQSFLIIVPFVLFALGRYLSGGRAPELERLSVAGGVALALAFVATFALHVLTFTYASAMSAGSFGYRPPADVSHPARPPRSPR